MSTASTDNAILTFTVTANGNVLPTTYAILSVAVNKEVNRIASAVIVIADGNAAGQDFDRN